MANLRLTFPATWLATILVLSFASEVCAQDTPNFDNDYWRTERDLAVGKMRRGAGLGVVGLASIAPTAILFHRSTDNPEGFLAYGVLSSIATMGMTLHGFLSVSFGLEQRDRADHFISLYRDDPERSNHREELDFHLYARKQSTKKVLLLGSTLVLVAGLSFTNGIVRSVKKHRGTASSEMAIWPSYLIGGLALPSGVGIIIAASRKYGNLRSLDALSTGRGRTISVLPHFQRNGETGETNFGLVGTMVF